VGQPEDIEGNFHGFYRVGEFGIVEDQGMGFLGCDEEIFFVDEKISYRIFL